MANFATSKTVALVVTLRRGVTWAFVRVGDRCVLLVHRGERTFRHYFGLAVVGDSGRGGLRHIQGQGRSAD